MMGTGAVAASWSCWRCHLTLTETNPANTNGISTSTTGNGPPAAGIASTDLIKNHPDKLRAILVARREAVQFIDQHTDDASKVLEKVYAPLPPKDVSTMMHQLVAAKFYSEGRIEMPLLQTTAHVMRLVGMLDKDVDLTKMIDPSFLPADLQK